MRTSFLFAALAALCLAGCAGHAGEKATEQERANIDRFVREGIKEGEINKANPTAPNPEVPKGLPGNQPVDAP